MPTWAPRQPENRDGWNAAVTLVGELTLLGDAAGLSDSELDVWTRHRLGASTADIARATERNPSTVRVRLMTARRKVAQHLSRTGAADSLPHSRAPAETTVYVAGVLVAGTRPSCVKMSRKSKYVRWEIIFPLQNWKISAELFATVLLVAGKLPAGVMNIPLCVPVKPCSPAIQSPDSISFLIVSWQPGKAVKYPCTTWRIASLPLTSVGRPGSQSVASSA